MCHILTQQAIFKHSCTIYSHNKPAYAHCPVASRCTICWDAASRPVLLFAFHCDYYAAPDSSGAIQRRLARSLHIALSCLCPRALSGGEQCVHDDCCAHALVVASGAAPDTSGSQCRQSRFALLRFSFFLRFFQYSRVCVWLRRSRMVLDAVYAFRFASGCCCGCRY